MGNDTQAADQLTASAHDVPGSHDGSTVFTFELRFSENFYLSYKTLRGHAFTVTGGEVTGARRLVPPSNIGWEIQVDAGRGRGGDHRAARDDGLHGGRRHLHGGGQDAVRWASAGRSGAEHPGHGGPTISGTAQVGETLAADTTGIADADGLDSAAFSYQWLAAAAEINGAPLPRTPLLPPTRARPSRCKSASPTMRATTRS